MRVFVLLTLLGASCLAAPAGAAEPESAKARAKWRLATLAASRQVLDSLGRLPQLDDKERVWLTDALCGSITTNLPAHVKRDASRARSRTLARDLQLQALEARIAEIVGRVGEQSQLPVRVEDVKAALGAPWSNRVEQAVESCLAEEYAKLFDAARARAVGLARQEVERGNLFPDDAALDTRLSAILKDRPGDARLTAEDGKALQAWLADLSAPGNGPVLEELQPLVDDVARKLFAEIRAQYEQQLAVLDSTAAEKVPPEKRQAGVIAEFLSETLEAQLAAKKKASAHSGVPVYGLMPSVRRNSRAVAQALEQARLRQYLSACPVALDVDGMASEIRQNLKAHASAADSERIFLTSRAETGRAAAAQDYAAEARPAGAAAYFENLLRADAALAAAYTNRVAAEVKSKLPEVRRRVSDAQFAKYFASLEKSVLLSDEAVTTLQDRGGDRYSSVPEAVALLTRGGCPGLADPQDEALLQETAGRFLELANERFADAFRALTAQLALLRQVEAGQMARLKEEVQAKRPVKDILGDWRTRLEKSWAAARRAAPTPYEALLDATGRQLDKTVRQLYDALKDAPAQTVQAERREAQKVSETDEKQATVKEIRQEAARPEERHDAEKPAANKEARPDPAASPQDPVVASILSRRAADRRNEPDGVLVLTEKDGANCQATFVATASAASQQVAFSAADPQASADAIFSAIKPQLETMLASVAARWREEQGMLDFLKRKRPAELKLFVVIESSEVRHRMSLLLRQKIEAAVLEGVPGQAAAIPAIAVNWKVGLTYDPVGTPP